MALNSNALTDVDTAKIILDIATADATQDTRVERHINAASAWIEAFSDRLLISQTVTEFHDGRRFDRITLDEWPITSITEVRFDLDSIFTDPNTLQDADTYVTGDDQELVLLTDTFPTGKRNIKVIYVAGYLAGTHDSDLANLEQACLQLVSWYERIEDDRDLGVTTKSKQDETTSKTMDVPDFIKNLVLRYRRVQFPTTRPIRNR